MGTMTKKIRIRIRFQETIHTTLSSHLGVELDSINGAQSFTWAAVMKTESFYLTKEFNSHWTGSGVM